MNMILMYTVCLKIVPMVQAQPYIGGGTRKVTRSDLGTQFSLMYTVYIKIVPVVQAQTYVYPH